MAVTLEELQIRFTAQMGGLTSQLNGVKKQLGGVTASAGKASTAMAGLAKMAKLFIGVYLVRGMVKIGKESLNMANDVVESEQLFAVSMKGMGDAARDWSDDLSASLGLNAYSLRKSVGIFNTMFMSMGLGTDKAYELSTGLVELAQDMSSFYNISSEEAFTKLRAGITGETEPLKQLGILVDENTTKQYALSTGISDTAKNMTQSQKVLARYEAILGQTADAQGDLARTISSPVNQIRILGNTLDMAKIALGQAFQPIQAIVLPLLSSLAQAALSAANALKTFMWALTGFTGIGANAGAIAGAGADANEDLTDSLNDSAKAYKAAGGAAKKASKDAKVGLKAFDEINKITEESADKGGGGGISEKPEIVAAEEQTSAMESLSVAVSKAAEWLKKLWDLALPTREAMSRLWDALSKFGSLVWDKLVWFYDKFLVPIGKWTVTRALPAFLDMLTAAVKMVNVAIENAGPGMQLFYDRVLVPIGNWAGNAIIDALKWLKERFDDLGEWIKNNQEKYADFVTQLFAFATGILAVWAAAKLITTISALFGTLGTALAFLTSPAGIVALAIAGLTLLILNWDKVAAAAAKAWEDIKNAWGVSKAWVQTYVIDPMARGFNTLWYYIDAIFIKPFRETWAATPEPVKQAFRDLWAGIDTIFIKPFREMWTWLKGIDWGSIWGNTVKEWENVKSAWSSAGDWFHTEVFMKIVDWGNQAWVDIKSAFSSSWATITALWSGLSVWFNTSVLQPTSKFFSDAWGAIVRWVSLAWETVKGAWNSASTWFNDNITAPIGKFFNDAFGGVVRAVNGAWKLIKDTWSAVAGWFETNVITPITTAWDELMKALGVKKDINININTYKTTYEKLVKQDPFGVFSNPDLKTGPIFPGFARGGVFEANKPILGLLGDQKSGRNIETPEKLLRQIFQQEVISGVRQTPSVSSAPINSNGNIVKQAVEAVLDRLQITLNVDGETWGRASVKHINQAQRMSGKLLLEM